LFFSEQLGHGTVTSLERDLIIRLILFGLHLPVTTGNQRGRVLDSRETPKFNMPLQAKFPDFLVGFAV
jgi:hypothetical protein